MRITELPPGEPRRLLPVAREDAFGFRLREMGFVPGTVITVRKRLKSGLELQLRGYRICLGKADAEGLFVE